MSIVIDLISSSPSPPLREASPRPPLSITDHATGCKKRLKAPAALEPFPSSDDFDLFLAEPHSKRRKTSPEPIQPASRPPLRLNQNVSLHRQALDPIEVSSSMEQPSPAVLHASRHSTNKSPLRPVPSRSAALTIDSDPFASSPDSARLPPQTASNTARRAVSLDPFIGSSSPAPTRITGPLRTSRNLPPSAQHIGSDFDCLDSVTRCKGSDVISLGDSSSDSDLPDISELRARPRPSRPLARSQSDIISSTRSRPAARPNASKPRKRPAQSAQDKEAEKERKRVEREEAKEAKARDKERAAALAEANKLRTDKKVSTPEMIVDLPSSLASDHRTQIETLLAEMGVEHSTWNSPHDCIKWRRKVTSRFDDTLGRWEPIPPRIHDETHALVIVTADRFIELMVSQEMEAQVRRITDTFNGHRVIFLLQGMNPWMRRNRNVRNRQFTSGVRADQAPARNRAKAVKYVPEEDIEDALLRLQVKHDVFIHHTTVPVETARWVVTFTQHISTIPYRKQRDHATSVAGFCMESGQVRTGDGPRDTYVKLLQEIVRVTAPIAYGVAAEFDTVSQLVRGLERGGPGRLEDVKKSANKDGQLSDRTIGQAVSRRFYKVFTGRNELSTDV